MLLKIWHKFVYYGSPVLVIAVIIFSVSSDRFYLLALPFLFLLTALFYLQPKLIYYVFFFIFFYPRAFFLKESLSIHLMDLIFPALLFVYFGSCFINKTHSFRYQFNKKLLIAFVFLFFTSVISILLNFYKIPPFKTLVSLWYLLHFLEIIIAFIIFSNVELKLNVKILACVFIVGSLLQLPIVLYQRNHLPALNSGVFGILGTFSREHHAAL